MKESQSKGYLGTLKLNANKRAKARKEKAAAIAPDITSFRISGAGSKR